MTEPYFESNRSQDGSVQYPYESMIHSSQNGSIVVDPHWHIYIEILYFLSGKAKVFLGGKSHRLETA